MNFNKVCVLGLGYIGLPIASNLAANAIKVIGMDTNPTIVKKLQSGELHIQEPDLKELFENAIRAGNLSIRDKVEPADAFIICVPTPFYDDKRADLRAVQSATESIVPHLRSGNLVVLESTSPPLTTKNLVTPILETSGLKAGEDFYLAYIPERVLPGKIIYEMVNNAPVIGGIDRPSAEAGRDLYKTFVRGEIVLTDATTAEMVKVMENTYRDINIAIANEFSRLATYFGINIWEAIDLANRHPRVKILQPGPGVGGHCVSVDPWFLVEAAPELTPLIRTARQVNDSQPEFVLDLVKHRLGKLAGKRLAALGLAFKPDVDDLRESPAIEVVHLLQKEGAAVKCYEPFKPDADLPGLSLAPSLESALEGCDALLLLVSHTQFRQLDPVRVAQLTQARIAIDTVHAWSYPSWHTAGFELYYLGTG